MITSLNQLLGAVFWNIPMLERTANRLKNQKGMIPPRQQRLMHIVKKKKELQEKLKIKNS